MPQHIIEGVAAPSAAPDFVGQHFVDTVGKVEYFSVGTASPADWIARGGGGGGSGSGYPATRAYAFLDFMYDRQVNKTVMRVSKDGGVTWRFQDGPNAGDHYPDYRGISDFAGPSVVFAGKVMAVQGRDYNDSSLGAGYQVVRVTNDLGVTWTEERQNAAAPTNPYLGLAQKSDDALTYMMVVPESGTDDYVLLTTNGGTSWSPVVIAGSLLTELDAGKPLAWYGLYSAFGFWFAVVSETNGAVSVHKSSDNGANWTSYGSFNDVDSINGAVDSGPTRVNDVTYNGFVVAPTLGVFSFAQAGAGGDRPAVYRDVDGVAGFTEVFKVEDDAKLGYSGAFPPGYWEHNMFGYAVDPDDSTERLWAFVFDQTDREHYGLSSTDGAAWSSDPSLSPKNMNNSASTDYNNNYKAPWTYDGHGMFGFYDGGSYEYPAVNMDGRGLTQHPFMDMESHGVEDDFLDPNRNSDAPNYAVLDYD